MADSTLEAIRKKVRRVTRSPSTAQISTTDLDEYINTFVLYNLPEQLRLFALRTTLTFYTEPHQDVYVTDTSLPSTDPLFNFQNLYITVHPPVYCAGYKLYYSQSRDEFFGLYPFLNTINQVGSGDGVTTLFSGTLSATPVLKNNVNFVSIDGSGNGLRLSDNGSGSFTGDIGIGANAIDYVTGQFSITYSTAPGTGEAINAETVSYQAARPNSMLYYDNTFTLRPVPDQVYPVIMEVYKRPTELLQNNQSPDLEQWWQLIALGAARLIFEDRSDEEGMARILPSYKEQERLVLRRTIVQQSNDRVATIYTEQLGDNNFGWNDSGFF